MTFPDIRPVILCGGGGERLWPLSRGSYPKQFSNILGGDSLLQATANRLTAVGCDKPLIMTASNYRFLVGEQMQEIGTSAQIVIEPNRRNTAPAIAAAARIVVEEDPDMLILVAPSDHMMKDLEDFRHALVSASTVARQGHLVTFGVLPDRPETAYGYIECTGETAVAGQAAPFIRFIEKPDQATARQMLETGHYLWNSGMFLFSAKSILAMFEKHTPQLLETVSHAVDGGKKDLDFFVLDAGYADCPDISIDYAVMEREAGMVVPISGDWNDLGSWKRIWRESSPDGNGVATGSGALAIDCQDTLLRCEGTDMCVVGLGLKNIIAIATGDAVLVADMNRSEDVKEVVGVLTSADAPQAEDFPRCHRPWGWYETLSVGPRFLVKNIMVKPGGVLSLQSHAHRAEHWVVVAGTARVTVGDDVRDLAEDQFIYVPLGAVHRLENPGKVEMHLIEVQTGTYLGEEDIIRYEDIYSRI